MWLSRSSLILDKIDQAALNFTHDCHSHHRFYLLGLSYGGIPLWCREFKSYRANNNGKGGLPSKFQYVIRKEVPLTNLCSKGIGVAGGFYHGCEHQLIPCKFFGSRKDDEERGLLYVGMTRARSTHIIPCESKESQWTYVKYEPIIIP